MYDDVRIEKFDTWYDLFVRTTDGHWYFYNFYESKEQAERMADDILDYPEEYILGYFNGPDVNGNPYV